MRQSRPRIHNRRGIVLVMTLGVLAMLTVAGAAFLMLMEQDYRASANAALKAQAELAARSGLEHAKLLVGYSEKRLASGDWLVASYQGAINAAGKLYSNAEEADSGWHRYFKDAAGDMVGEDAAPWIPTGTHYAGVSTKGRAIPLEGSAVKRGQYSVCVVDLDGKLHGDIQRYGRGTDPPKDADLSNMVQALGSISGLTPDQAVNLAAWSGLGTPYLCVSELARRAGALAPSRKYGLEQFLTIYPRVPIEPPAVNVDTARVELLAELLKPIPSFAGEQDKAVALANYLEAERPFPGRADFEEAVRAVTGFDAWRDLGPHFDPPETDKQLNEIQFNDLLNSTNRSDDSLYDDPDNPGEYSFDGWPPYDLPDESGPHQTGGEATLPDDNLTWSTELKFDSRFFHIYALGRACTSSGEVTGISARLHAVFDAEQNKVIWLRWLCSPEGSVVDLQ